MMPEDDRVIRNSIAYLKRQLAGTRDPVERRDLEITIQSLELKLPDAPRNFEAQAQAQPAGGVSATAAPDVAAPAAPTPAPAPSGTSADARRVIKDPNRAYTESVQRALVDAMIDFSAPMVLSENDWLTVAARDNEPRDTFAPQDPYEEVVTILLRIKGSDLAAYRAGKIDREEAKKRVELREF